MGFVYLHQDKNYYNVPFRYIGNNVEVQYNSIDIEVYYKSERIASHNKIKNIIKKVNNRYPATIQDIDYSANRHLNKNTFERLALLDFILNRENIIITGATGIGKSYLAQALGNQACMMLIKTLYFNTSRLMDYLEFVYKVRLLPYCSKYKSSNTLVFCGLDLSQTLNSNFIDQTLDFIDKHYLVSVYKVERFTIN